jgi:hypothetical protein
MNAKAFPGASLKIAAILPVLMMAGICSAEIAVTNTPAAPAADKAKPAAQSTNDAPAELPIPLSVFEGGKGSKDPFYPLSTRMASQQVTTNVATISASSFKLGGLSGFGKKRLALINNRTLAEGEDGEVTTATGTTKIRLIAIKEESVIVQVVNSGDTIEIFLRKGAR